MDTPTRHVNAAGSPPGQPQVTGRQTVGFAIAGVAVISLVVASVVAWYAQSPPSVVARKYLSDQGVAAGHLDLAGVRDHGTLPVFPFPKDATVEFRAEGGDPPRKLEVKLTRAVYFLPWYATGFQETAEK
jgi:hypothetical protein